MRVTVWGEGFLDLAHLGGQPPPLKYTDYAEIARRIYPDEVHGAIAGGLSKVLGSAAEVRTASLDDPESGLGKELLEATDVLVWWSHVKEHLIPDAAVERVRERILREGMGLVALHSGAQSRVFRSLMGTRCGTGGWRQSDDWEAIWTVSPGHPIARGLPPVFVLPTEEVWCEPFDIPEPDELVFLSTFRGGEVFRSGCCYRRGRGRIFYFRPGHESHPTYHRPEVCRLLANAVGWAGETGASTLNAAITDAAPMNAAMINDVTGELSEGWFRP